ncbi:MAG TPA: saccharopine dehydrogenase NADP-binding domain-containing protein [Candidatus Nitrosotenuis sp.]|nr:saccharopine dehydrogenase NADP-binding domain-containing protein [Candidatus Nitrosotenuis sp.]
MRILVLGGCGAMGTEATRDLAATSDFEEIVVADLDEERAGRLCAELGGGRLRPRRVDVTDVDSLVPLFAAFDVVLNCTSYHFGLGITRAAIRAGRPLLDLGGLYNTPRQLALDDEARRAGATIVLGMGATPGVTNLLARAASTHMDVMEEVHIAFASYRPIAPSPGLLDTVLDEFSPATVRFYYENGQFVQVPAFSGERQVRFAPPIGTVPTYFVPHSETHTLPRSFPSLRRVDVRGTWPAPIMAGLRHYYEVGLLCDEPVEVDGVAISPRRFLRAFYLARHASDEADLYGFFLNVEAVGRRGEFRVVATYNLSHPTDAGWGLSTTARVTGIPASIGAQRLARGEARGPGVLAPENAFDPWGFFAELARRDLWVHEEMVTERHPAGKPGPPGLCDPEVVGRREAAP